VKEDMQWGTTLPDEFDAPSEGGDAPQEDSLRINAADLAPDEAAVEVQAAVAPESAEVHEEEEEVKEDMQEEPPEVKAPNTPTLPQKKAPLGVASTNSPAVNP